MEVKNRKIYTYIENNMIKIETIMNDYTNYIYTIIRNMNIILPNEDIEEVVLDVFLTLWKNQTKLDINKNMSSYISGITKNLIKYKYRQNKHLYNVDDYVEQLIDLKNVELVLTQNEREKIIDDELEKMKKEDKDIFIEYYYSSKNIRDISKIFNMSDSKVKSKLFRIRKKLSKVLNERGYSSNEK